MTSLPPPASPTDTTFSAADAQTIVVPVLEETATIQREMVETGRVRLTKTVETHEEVLPLTLRHEEVTVERVAFNQLLPPDAPAPVARQQGDTLIVPVLREVTITHLLLVEEVHVTTQHVTTSQPQTVSLRQEHVEVTRLPASAATPPIVFPEH